MEEANQDVQEEVVAPEAESENDDQEQVQQRQEPAYGSQEYNFREMRRIIEQQQREMHELRESMAERLNNEPDESISDDEIPTVKQVRRIIEKEARKGAEELYKQKQLENYEEALRHRYKDFDAVVSKENVEELIRGNARLHSRLVKLHEEDPVEANELAYELIKKSAFYNEKQKKTAQTKATKQMAQKNASKPVAGHAVGSTPTPLQQASSFKSLSQEERYRLWQEMQACASRR